LEGNLKEEFVFRIFNKETKGYYFTAKTKKSIWLNHMDAIRFFCQLKKEFEDVDKPNPYELHRFRLTREDFT
jgi:hypothetical protein